MGEAGNAENPSGEAGLPIVELGLDGYEQAREVARGGYSVVYRAWQPSFKRLVAIKVLAEIPDPDSVDRFARECVAIGALSGHPNIVTVHESGRLPNNHPFIVMEFLSGGSLAQRLANGPLAWSEAVDIGVKLAGALESAHRAGVLHRDVKPENVVLSPYGECKLGDFGIARVQGEAETKKGPVAATYAHAAPEIIDGKASTVASDLYSLASTIFALLDGRAPFVDPADTSLLPLLGRVGRDPVRPLGRKVPEALERIVRQGLEKDAARRQPTAAELGRQLQLFQAQAGVAVTVLPLAVDGSGSADRRTKGWETVVSDAVPNLGDIVGAAPGDDSSVTSSLSRARRRPRGVAVSVAALLVAGIIVTAVFTRDDGTADRTARPAGTVGSTSASPVTSTATSTVDTSASSLAPTTLSSTSAGAVRLGSDLSPDTTEPCRQPRIASGAAWTLGPARLGGRAFDVAYSCNIFAGATGSLDFVLGKSYRLLRASVGFDDSSVSTRHQVRFEITGDDREYLTEPLTLKFGDVRELEIDVTGVTRLRIRISELSSPGGDEAPSMPVLAVPILVRY